MRNWMKPNGLPLVNVKIILIQKTFSGKLIIFENVRSKKWSKNEMLQI